MARDGSKAETLMNQPTLSKLSLNSPTLLHPTGVSSLTPLTSNHRSFSPLLSSAPTNHLPAFSSFAHVVVFFPGCSPLHTALPFNNPISLSANVLAQPSLPSPPEYLPVPANP